MQRRNPFSDDKRSSRPRSIYCTICPSFHGATLLSLLLSNHSRVLSLGDTHPVLDHGIVCSCGEAFESCPFWREMSESLSHVCDRTLVPSYPNLLPVDLFPWSGKGPLAPAMRQTRQLLTRLNSPLAGLVSLGAIRLGVTLPGRRFKTAYSEFLQVCARHHEFDLFVDGYKSMTRYLSLKASGLPVEGVIHVLRDPRAFAASCKRAGQPVASAAGTWSMAHRLIESCVGAAREDTVTIRYEDLCRTPTDVLEQLQTFMGLESEAILRPFAPDLHWLGNESLSRFKGEVRLNERWREELDEAELETVRLKAGKTARRYGYDLG